MEDKIDTRIGHKHMAPAPWKITANGEWIYSTIRVPNGGNVICLQPDMEESLARFPANASAIVSAVNNTWGAGINPDSVIGFVIGINVAVQTLR